MRPLRTVEKPAFQKMCDTIAGQTVDLPSAKSLKNDKNIQYLKIKEKLIELIVRNKYICVTADGWSCLGASYLGMTAHFYDDFLIRKSFMLCLKKCLRVKHLTI